MNNMGLVLKAGGFGLEQDAAAAAAWFRRSAEGGCVQGMTNLGEVLYYGSGVPEDKAEGLAWLRRGAEGGCSAGMWALGYALVMSSAATAATDTEGVGWIRRAAEVGGDVQVMAFLGRALLERKNEAEGNEAEAVKWLREAAPHSHDAVEDLCRASDALVGAPEKARARATCVVRRNCDACGSEVEDETSEDVAPYVKFRGGRLRKSTYAIARALAECAREEMEAIPVEDRVCLIGTDPVSVDEGVVLDKGVYRAASLLRWLRGDAMGKEEGEEARVAWDEGAVLKTIPHSRRPALYDEILKADAVHQRARFAAPKKTTPLAAGKKKRKHGHGWSLSSRSRGRGGKRVRVDKTL